MLFTMEPILIRKKLLFTAIGRKTAQRPVARVAKSTRRLVVEPQDEDVADVRM